MSKCSHLALQDVLLPAASEWSSSGTGWSFLSIAQGLGYALRAGSAQELSEGQTVVFALSAPLTIRASQLSDMKLQFFQLSPEMLGGFFTLYEQHCLESAAGNPALAARFFPAADPFAQKFAVLCASEEPRHSLLYRARLLGLAADLLNAELLPQREAGKRHIAARERFEHLIQRMPAAEIQNRTVGELAEECGCSERHFSRIFRHYFGFSIRAKQIEMRLQKARQMLQESDARMIYVAMESGFRHLSLFNAVFKKRFGLTPSEWRRQNSSGCRSPRIVRLS